MILPFSKSQASVVTRFSLANGGWHLFLSLAPFLIFICTFSYLWHLFLSGPPIATLNITPADVDLILKDLNTIWSQAGIAFTLVAANRFEPQTTLVPNQFDVNDTAIPFRGSSTDDVTAINNRANVIDVYLVRRIGYSSGSGDIAGTTIYEGMNSYKAGILVAKETTQGNNVQTRSDSEMTRTLAHEMGHYLMKSKEHRDSEPWNIMSVDSDEKLDIDKTQATSSRTFVPVQ